MKKYVLMISQHFPQSHYRAGEATGFIEKIKDYEKLHTIRGNYGLWQKRFREIDAGRACLSVRIWEGAPYRSRQLEIYRYDRGRGIGLQKLVIEPTQFSKGSMVAIDGRFYQSAILLKIAQNDGLRYQDFSDWFADYDLGQPLALIHFTDYRYGAKVDLHIPSKSLVS